MRAARMLFTTTACAAVGVCALAVVNMSQTTDPSATPERPVIAAESPSWRPAYAPTLVRGRASGAAGAPATERAATSPRASIPVTLSPSAESGGARLAEPLSAPVRTPAESAAPTPADAASASAAPRSTQVATRPASAPVVGHAPARPAIAAAATHARLPLRFSTGRATRVITVVARSRRSTTARLQAWTKTASGRWRKHGSAVIAHIGADGMSRHPSESRSATPIGTFTLTQAFGRAADPGTALPYFKTRPSDWWVSQPGALYNTHQRCSSRCAFRQGAPNEHLYYETPYYDYAAVIDYNTRNAPGGVRQGRGSAFFLHVTDGTATAGCVAIRRAKLIALLRWLRPSSHPRILIGVA